MLTSYPLAPFLALPWETRLALVGVSVLLVLFHVRFSRKVAIHGPSVLTTTGIFFTFLGIAQGLARLNPADMASSVPDLLEGLKTAFWASVAGVAGALTLKLRDFITPQSGVESGRGSLPNLERILVDLTAQLRKENGPGLLTEVQLMRTDMVRGLDALRSSQDKSLDALAQMGSAALIKALEAVIRDFNARLTSQFGDNFARLNDAVIAMVVWQENYRSQIQALEKANITAADAVRDTAQAYTAILDNTQTFATAAGELHDVILSLNEQLPTLNQNTADISELVKMGREALPLLRGDIEAFAAALRSSLSQSAEALVHSASGAAEDLRSANDELVRGSTELASSIRAQSRALEQELETCLTTSLTTLGRQLTALSEKFVHDYEPLTRELRRLVEALSEAAQ
ncbi:hypothetical protein WDZ92_11565 [Nostoc sp. NIES-2111]